MVGEPQIAAEPQNDRRITHIDSVDGIGSCRMVEREITVNLNHIAQPSTMTAPYNSDHVNPIESPITPVIGPPIG